MENIYKPLTAEQMRKAGSTEAQIRLLAELEYTDARLQYEKLCFEWSREKGAFPVPPEISPPLGYRMEGSLFDDKYYYAVAFEKFKDALFFVQKGDGRSFPLPQPPRPLLGKPSGRTVGRYPFRELVKEGLTLTQSAAVMKTAQEAGYSPADVIRELINEFLHVVAEEPKSSDEKKPVGRPKGQYQYREIMKEGLTLQQSAAVMIAAQKQNISTVQVIRDLIEEQLVDHSDLFKKDPA